jgi:hypothetical protein
MNNIDTIYKLWISFFYGNEENYLAWLADVKAKMEAYNLPAWLMEFVNALPYVATLLSFVFVIYLFYLLIIFFKGLINVLENPSDGEDDFKRAAPNTADKVKTYYYFKKKPGRKKRRF